MRSIRCSLEERQVSTGHRPNPGASIGEVTRRTPLAQSLVSRITHAMAEAGALTTAVDASDRRRIRVELDPGTRDHIIHRAGKTITGALAGQTPRFCPGELADLEHHLGEAERLLSLGRERPDELLLPAKPFGSRLA